MVSVWFFSRRMLYQTLFKTSVYFWQENFLHSFSAIVVFFLNTIKDTRENIRKRFFFTLTFSGGMFYC